MLIGSTCENEEHKLYKHGESVSGRVLLQTGAGSRLVPYILKAKKFAGPPFSKKIAEKSS